MLKEILIAISVLITCSSSTNPPNLQWCRNGKGLTDGNTTGEDFFPSSLELPSAISGSGNGFPVRLTEGGWFDCPPEAGAYLMQFKMDGSGPVDPPSGLIVARDKKYFKIFRNGYLRIMDIFYPPAGFCIDNWTPDIIQVRLCGRWKLSTWEYPQCHQHHVCVPRCCSITKLYVEDGKSKATCLESQNEGSEWFRPTLYKSTYRKLKENPPVYFPRNMLLLRTGNYTKYFHSGHPHVDPNNKLCFRLRQDGFLLYRKPSMDWIAVHPKDYCVDGSESYGMTYVGGEEQTIMFLAHDDTVKKDSNKEYISQLYGSFLLLASVFLLLTLLVYVLLWRDQKIQGWTTMSHAASMFFMYFFLGLNYFMRLGGGSMTRTDFCVTIGVVTHFFFLSNFCWLTVICFSLFWTFRAINLSNPNSKNLGQYAMYAAFGWGCPLIFVTVSFILDLLHRDTCDEVMVPLYGILTCTVSTDAVGPYMYYPIGVLLLLNAFFFIITSVKLYNYKKSTSIATRDMDDKNQLFRLISKLFIVMGFTWIFEFLSWQLGGNALSLDWYWIVFDFINCLQPVAIFVIYVCKPNILKSLRTKYPGLKPFLSFTNDFLPRTGTMESSLTHTTVVEGSRRYKPNYVNVKLLNRDSNAEAT